jgi:hypothetical protein
LAKRQTVVKCDEEHFVLPPSLVEQDEGEKDTEHNEKDVPSPRRTPSCGIDSEDFEADVDTDAEERQAEEQYDEEQHESEEAPQEAGGAMHAFEIEFMNMAFETGDWIASDEATALSEVTKGTKTKTATPAARGRPKGPVICHWPGGWSRTKTNTTTHETGGGPKGLVILSFCHWPGEGGGRR